MYAIDEISRKLKNLVLKGDTDALMVQVEGVTLTAGDVSVSLTDTNTKLDTLITKATSTNTKLDSIIALLTTIAANTTPV
jgi:hypothetical protein